MINNSKTGLFDGKAADYETSMLRGSGLPPRCKWDPSSSRMLRGI